MQFNPIFPIYTQLDSMDCGPTCLRMVARHYGKHYSLQTLRENSFITRAGVSMLDISDAAEQIGFRTSGVMISIEGGNNQNVPEGRRSSRQTLRPIRRVPRRKRYS